MTTTTQAPAGPRLAAAYTPVDHLTQAERAARRARLLTSIPLADQARDYVPLDAALRAQTYRAARGVADGWPVPLTRCTSPAQS